MKEARHSCAASAEQRIRLAGTTDLNVVGGRGGIWAFGAHFGRSMETYVDEDYNFWSKLTIYMYLLEKNKDWT